MKRGELKAVVVPSGHPPSRERLGEIAEGLLEILAGARIEAHHEGRHAETPKEGCPLCPQAKPKRKRRNGL